MQISVIIPSYNQAQYLEQTLLSIINQSIKAEIIIIDGGSTDGSVELIKSYEGEIAYWVSEKDKGLSHALNKGLQVATGDIIGWQNSDDLYLPGAFEHLAKVWDKDIDVFFGDVVLANEVGDFTRRLRYCPFSVNDILYYGNVMTNQSAFFNREFLVSTGGLDEAMKVAMDGELYLRLRSHSNRFRHIPFVLGALRIYGNTITARSKADGTSITEWVDVRRKYGVEMSKDLPWGKQFRVGKYKYLVKKALYLTQIGALPYVVRGVVQRNALKQDW